MVNFQPGLRVGFNFVYPWGNLTKRSIFQLKLNILVLTILSWFALAGKLKELFIF